jgi:hypothetical protein
MKKQNVFTGNDKRLANCRFIAHAFKGFMNVQHDVCNIARHNIIQQEQRGGEDWAGLLTFSGFIANACAFFLC